MGTPVRDRQAANALMAAYTEAFKERSLKRIVALLHPDGRDKVRRYHQSFFDAQFVSVKATVEPYKAPKWEKLRTHEFYPPPVYAMRVTLKNRYCERDEFFPVARIPGSEDYCIAFMRTRGAASGDWRTEFDLDAFRVQLAEAARKVFGRLQAQHRGERFYAFALYSDGDAMTVLPAANTESGLADRVKKYRYTSEEDILYLRWATAEWKYEATDAYEFDVLCSQLAEVVLDKRRVKGGRARFRQRAYKAAIGALEDLEKEGFFGRGQEREAVTVFFTISDSDEASKYERQSARRLNPAVVYKRFIRG